MAERVDFVATLPAVLLWRRCEVGKLCWSSEEGYFFE
jgi:hypothetical protein